MIAPLEQHDLDVCLYCDARPTRFEEDPFDAEVNGDDSIKYAVCDDPKCNEWLDELLAMSSDSI